MLSMNQDVYCCILSHISDTKTLNHLLSALPRSHLLLPVALERLWQLHVYLDSYDPQASAASQKILGLLDSGPGRVLAEFVRHLSVSVEHDPPPLIRVNRRIVAQPPFAQPADAAALYARLPELFRQAVNLESLDYRSFPGKGMGSEHVDALQYLAKLRKFAVDCALRSRDQEVSAAVGTGNWSAEYDAENWE
jgi:hypothetical protein